MGTGLQRIPRRPSTGTGARLFLAIWPDAEVRGHLAKFRDAWAWPLGARQVPDMRLHLTLHFIGSFPRAAIDDLAARLATVAERPLVLRAGRAEMWPGGLAVLRIDPEPALLDLQRELGSLLSALALPIDTRPYAPHVTLARKADAARAPDTRPVLDWNARGFELVESVGGANPSYAVLRSFPATG